MLCRPACGACCIAPSITSPLPGHPGGKPAGQRCAHLLGDLRCELWGGPDYPAVCRGFQPCPDACGGSREEALALLSALEEKTRP